MSSIRSWNRRFLVSRVTSKRRGQALLLAVLLMLFVALLGATFVTVVALNLNQTARTEDKTRAREAARAGLGFVNDQLTNSAKGLKWRPQNPNPDNTPLPTPKPNSNYYNGFEQAQGWSSISPPAVLALNPDSLTRFVKYPDPSAPNASAGPQFLAKVELIHDGRRVESSDPPEVVAEKNAATSEDKSDNSTGDKTGDLRITVIGQSPDNPAAFEKTISYKHGLRHNLLIENARTVTNNYLAGNTVPTGRVKDNVTSGSSIVLTDLKGSFPSFGAFYVTIGGPTTSTQVRGQTVQSISVDPTTREVTLKLPDTATVTQGERVQLAAALGAPIFADLDNVASTTPATVAAEQINFNLSGAIPGGVFTNGGLVLMGYVQANLRATNLDGTTGGIRSAGLQTTLPVPNYAGNPNPIIAKVVSGQYGPDPNNDKVVNADLVNSNDANFPGNWSSSGGSLSPAQKDLLVSDDYNLQANNPDPTRQVRPVVPPNILSGSDANRYRQLTKFSKSTISSEPNAALYGYGEGIYINNPQDKERTFDTSITPNRLREVRHDEFVEMLSSNQRAPVTPVSRRYLRNSAPQPATATVSLEDQHLRGWVGMDEFRPRGVEIEPIRDPADVAAPAAPTLPPKIAFTLDSRDDLKVTGGTSNQGAVPAKGWSNPDGTLAGDATNGGVYRKILPWPKNGTIFAEGNIRIKGQVANAPCSLTVVSMNNIYIEGSLDVDTRPLPIAALPITNPDFERKLVLLPRKNAIVNPTRLIARIDEQTRLSSDLTAPTAPTVTDPPVNVSVYNASAFQVGEWIEIADSTNSLRGRVTSTPTTETDISVQFETSSTPNAGAVFTATDQNTVVRTLGDQPSNAVPLSQASALRSFDGVLQRRFNLPAAGDARFAMIHGAEQNNVLTITRQGGPNPMLVDSKLNRTSTTTEDVDPSRSFTPGFPTADKIVRVDDTTAKKEFPQNATTDRNNTFNIGQLKSEIRSTGQNPTPARYNETASITSFDSLPYIYLAGVGNRYPIGYDPTADVADSTKVKWRANAATPANIPLATSLWLGLNNVAKISLQNDRYDSATSAYETSSQLGVSENYSGTTPSSDDDVLTGDRSFYSILNINPGGILAPNAAIPGGSSVVPSVINETIFDTAANVTNFFSNLTRDARTLTGAKAGFNSIALRENPSMRANYGAQQMPTYYLNRLKLENSDRFAASSVTFNRITPPFAATASIPAEFDIHAFVYAQEGSWLVIPGPYFDDTARNGSAFPADAALDFDRDGTLSDIEKKAGYAYHRYNYRIAFTGSIMENRSPIVADVGTGTTAAHGVVGDWMDKWMTLNDVSGNVTSSPITYTYDPSIAQDINGVYGKNDLGLQLPASPDLIYVGYTG